MDFENTTYAWELASGYKIDNNYRHYQLSTIHYPLIPLFDFRNLSFELCW